MNKSLVALLGVTVGVNLAWAGAVTFRVVIDLPARHRIGAFAFAELSRATDLAGGLFFYPVAAIGSAVLSCAVWFAARRARAPRFIRRASAAAAAATLLVLAVTTQAAPLMFRIGAAGNDPAVVGPLAERFAALSDVRAFLADAGAVALLCALTISGMRAAGKP
jgi:hypothetical protein